VRSRSVAPSRPISRRVLTVCFIEGHNELPMDNYEFHTHLEGVAGHSHDDASSRLVRMGATESGAFAARWKRRATKPASSFSRPAAKFLVTARSSSPPTRAPHFFPAKAPRCAAIWRRAEQRCFFSTARAVARGRGAGDRAGRPR
jgi:hypothetical protein